MDLMSRIKEPELGAERLGNLARVGRDVWCLWGHSNEHLHEEVARRNIRSIE